MHCISNNKMSLFQGEDYDWYDSDAYPKDSEGHWMQQPNPYQMLVPTKFPALCK